MAKRMKWVRNGTICGPNGTEIDLSTEDEKHWITIKADSDRAGELLCTKLLRLLNAEVPR